MYVLYAAKSSQEEVFAESYDDNEETTPNKSNQHSNTGMVTNAEHLERIKFMGYPCCPNKSNVYHECSLYCQNHWNTKRSNGPEPGSEYDQKHKSMMEKLGALPEDWQEKWDPGILKPKS